ncbi:MAG: hypothetical protein AB8B69_17430, partial [Chitinophagales bacterium]
MAQTKNLQLFLTMVLLFFASFQLSAQAQWTNLGGSGSDIAIDGNNQIWTLGSGNVIYLNGGAGWQTYANNSKGKRIAADTAGTPYVVGMDNGTYKGTGMTTAMTAYGG